MKYLSIAFTLGVLTAVTAPARAETITGRFTYADAHGPNAIRYGKVEIWANDPGSPFWNPVYTTWTDDNGAISVPLPFVVSGRRYGLRVFAENYAAIVQTIDVTWFFFRRPRESRSEGEIIRAATRASDVLDFSWNFDQDFEYTHFNLAETIRLAHDYAAARRAPGETDIIGRITVWPHHTVSADHGTYYEPIPRRMVINNWFTMDDYTIMHEYAHHLEMQISRIDAVPTVHDGCSINGGTLQYETIGWMEGFASYFPHAVRRSLASGYGVTFNAGDGQESPPSCGHPGDTVENFIAAALWDLVDDTPAEGFDQVCGKDLEIFQIFDADLASSLPTADIFARAWQRRGHDYFSLQTIFTANGLTPPRFAASVTYDFDMRADIAVWRPGGGAQWFIRQSSTDTAVAPISWGTWDDEPVPADYDGDGLIDVAVWRPSSGEWFTLLSTGGAAQRVQWGTLGDIPSPGNFDGDAEVEFAVYRPWEGQFYIHADACGDAGPVFFGVYGAIPAVGDYDGDGVDDLALYEPDSGTFTVRQSSWGWTQEYIGGRNLDQPVARDYDGDGRTDMAVYRASTGEFSILRSTTGVVSEPLRWESPWQVPVPADYDGDGRADLATWDPATGWWSIQSVWGGASYRQWGWPGDIPVPANAN